MTPARADATHLSSITHAIDGEAVSAAVVGRWRDHAENLAPATATRQMWSDGGWSASTEGCSGRCNWDCATFNDGYLAMRRKKFISSRNWTAVLRVQARGAGRMVLAPFLPQYIVVRSTMNRPSTRTEIAIGRALASIVHPYAAWRTRSMKRRAFLIASYVAVGYAAGLALLLFRAPSAIW